MVMQLDTPDVGEVPVVERSYTPDVGEVPGVVLLDTPDVEEVPVVEHSYTPNEEVTRSRGAGNGV